MVAMNEGGSAGRRYLVISPVRDEEAFVQRTIDSVVGQTERPALWIIVDDGSSDATPTLLADAAAQHDWIRVITRPPRKTRVLGSGVVHAFNVGLDSVDLSGFEYVSKLDADLVLPAGYYAALMDLMEADPRLATASGRPYVDTGGPELEPERAAAEMSAGMAKFYRLTAFRDIGGLVPEIMWDGIDAHESRVKGWRSGSFEGPELNFWHLRPEGGSDRGVLRGRRRHGFGQWFMGTGPEFMLASALLRARDEPAIVGSLHMLYGYFSAALRGVPRHGTVGFRRELRRFQRESMVLGKASATRRWERRNAARWIGTPRARRAAYLVSEYPALSHTFIEREITSLRDLGWEIVPISLRPGTAGGGEEVTALQAVSKLRLLGVLVRAMTQPTVLARLVHHSLWPSGWGRPRPVGLGYALQALLLLRELERHDLHHVHVHFANNASEVARLAAAVDSSRLAARGVSWSVTIHGLWMHGRTNSSETDTWPHGMADRWGPLVPRLRDAAGVVAISETTAEQLRSLDAGLKVEVIRLGVDIDHFSPAAEPAPDSEVSHLLFVGRLAAEKDVATLLRAMAALDASVTLTVVGAGPAEVELRELAMALGVADRVRWHGPATQRELPDLYRAAEVVVMTSRNEGIPVVLMEAMACGVPVVATEVGGIPELVTDGVNGLLVPAGDPGAVSDAVARMVTDGAWSRELGANGRDRVVTEFNTRVQARRLSDWLTRHIDRSG